MNGFLIDTNVISEIVRPSPDRNVAAWSQSQPKQNLFLSVVSVARCTKGDDYAARREADSFDAID
jgi:predicted nucleic acid-binding protein